MTELFSRALTFFPLPLRAALLSCMGTLEKGARISEVRVRKNAPLSLTVTTSLGEENLVCARTPDVTEQTLRTVLSQMCCGSYHAYENEILRGWFSPRACEGIRVGVAGDVICEGERVATLRGVQALCLRVPGCLPQRDEISLGILHGELLSAVKEEKTSKKPLQSVLFYAPPGVGKTTLLRNLIKGVASGKKACRASVIDTSAELYTSGFEDTIADFFIGYPKELGIGLAVRAFSPEVIFCDELGSHKETESLLRAQVGGVPIVATAHADHIGDLLCRPAFALLHQDRIFDRYIRLYRVGDTFSFVEEKGGESSC